MTCGCDGSGLVQRPVTLGGFGFLQEALAVAQIAAVAKDVVGGNKSSKAPPAPPPPPPGIFDSFGPQYKPLVIAGAAGLGALVFVRLLKAT